MAGCFDELRSLGDEALDYARIRWASLRLETVEGLSSAAARIMGAVIGGVAVTVALMFLAVAGALWLGELLGHPAWGFLAAGGLFLAAGALFFGIGRRIFLGPMIRYFIRLFFTDKE
ncbi:MAG: phage holin family protein [Alistipes sp.]|jgi:uncharacterized membrane protein YedE/YeeE|nr:phage holin family protein [Alistipes sp.]